MTCSCTVQISPQSACSETFYFEMKNLSSLQSISWKSEIFVHTICQKKTLQYGGLIIILQFIVFLYPLLVVLRSGTKKVENLRNRWFVSWPIEPSCFLLTPSLTQVVFMWRMFLLEKSDSQLGPKPRLLQCGKSCPNSQWKSKKIATETPNYESIFLRYLLILYSNEKYHFQLS